jgi:2-(1,2-epoxy-1,2-dihydrophenyl)acetyl-CoA isomerase
MQPQTIRYEKRDGVAQITLDRPDAMNAISVDLAVELRRTLDDAGDDAGVRAVLLTGSGRAFCAGGDVAVFHRELDRSPDVLRDILLNLHAALGRMARIDKPVIGAINGIAAGAGMALALATDLAVAAESASFTMAYTGIGASPDGSSTFFLPRLVGTRRALELALLNRTVPAAEALELGLVNRVVADAELAQAATELAQRLAAGPTLAYARPRRLVRQSLETGLGNQLEDEADAIISMARTDDFREGVTAFVEKRKPRFTGR